MNPRSVIFLPILAFCGAFGCAPAMLPLHSSQFIVARELPNPEIKNTPAAVLNEEVEEPFSNTALLAFFDQEDILEETLMPPLPGKTSDSNKKNPAKTKKPNEVQKKAPSAISDPDDSAALQKAPGPRADNRLLDLLEQDIDRAVESPKERRRLEFSDEVSGHPKVRYFIELFSNRERTFFAKILARSGRYLPMIANVLSDEGLPEELAYLALIESAFQTGATSSQGAVGLWQFVPSTARMYGLRIDAWVDERRDPEKSTRAAAAYLKQLHSHYGRWFLATAAYNAGPGAIDKAMQKSGAKDFWTLSRKAKISDETRNFVPKFVAAAIIATNPETYGFEDLQYETPLEYETVEIRRSMRLGTLAEMAQADVSTIRELNPALLRKATPPTATPFTVKLPVGKSRLFAKAYEDYRANETLRSVTHEVKKGETLILIARRYGQEVGALMRLNGLANARIRIGQKLKVLVQNFGGNLR